MLQYLPMEQKRSAVACTANAPASPTCSRDNNPSSTAIRQSTCTARGPPKLPCPVGDGKTAVIGSARGVQQGGSRIGPLGYSSAGGGKILKEDKAAAPVPGERVSALHKWRHHRPPRAGGVRSVRHGQPLPKVVGWVQARLTAERGHNPLNRLSRRSSSPGGVEAGGLSAGQHADLGRTELTIAGKGRETTGAPVGTDNIQ